MACLLCCGRRDVCEGNLGVWYHYSRFVERVVATGGGATQHSECGRVVNDVWVARAVLTLRCTFDTSTFVSSGKMKNDGEKNIPIVAKKRYDQGVTC